MNNILGFNDFSRLTLQWPIVFWPRHKSVGLIHSEELNRTYRALAQFACAWNDLLGKRASSGYCKTEEPAEFVEIQ